ncbi:MAG: GNAT family N-acetyltransferase [Eggerthellaceae bacterium]|nr:GNAT family N-acetyltransferase [Eggerthellaceae bacterium]
MSLSFIAVETEDQLKHLADVASEIWHEYWPARIGADQTDYMVEMFHSVEAMHHDIEEHGYRYWFLVDDEGREVGYTAGCTQKLTGDAQADEWMRHGTVVDQKWPERFFISKVYLYAQERGKHYGSAVLAFFEQLCRDEGLPAMYLTVNRENELGIRAYLAKGFVSVEDVDADIGNGFVMYDHIMVKEID